MLKPIFFFLDINAKKDEKKVLSLKKKNLNQNVKNIKI